MFSPSHNTNLRPPFSSCHVGTEAERIFVCWRGGKLPGPTSSLRASELCQVVNTAPQRVPLPPINRKNVPSCEAQRGAARCSEAQQDAVERPFPISHLCDGARYVPLPVQQEGLTHSWSSRETAHLHKVKKRGKANETQSRMIHSLVSRCWAALTPCVDTLSKPSSRRA